MLELLRKYRTPLLAAVLALATMLLYSSQLRHREQPSLFHKVVLQLTAPLQKLLDGTIEKGVDAWDHYLWLVGTEERNAELEAENQQLKSDLIRLEEVRLANQRLRELLDFREAIKLPALPAQVIAEDASSWFRTVVIDKGSEDGLREGLPVVVAAGVVGRTLEVSSYQSRVLLITDASSAVAVLVQSTRSRGVCRGEGDILSLDYLLRREDIREGDQVITSGTGGIYPKGLPVGRVVEVRRGDFGLFQAVRVEPAVDFSRLEEVLVLLREER